MIVTVSNSQRLHKNYLPDKVTGKYWIRGIINDKLENLFSVEALSGKWIGKSNKKFQITDTDGSVIKQIEINDKTVFMLAGPNGEGSLVYTNSASETGKTFNHIIVPNNTDIEIGRNEENKICYINKYVSGNHAVLRYRGGKWSVIDTNSVNGTYVNGNHIINSDLYPGDVISIVQLRIIVADGFIAINNPSGQVVYDENYFEPLKISEPIQEYDDEEEKEDETFFSRSPRLKQRIEPPEIKISEPPASAEKNRVPMIMMIGPSMTMGMASGATGVFSVLNAMSRNAGILSVMPTLIMSFSMLCGMLLWPSITRRYERKMTARSEFQRQTKYAEYLSEIRDEIQREIQKQETILNENNVSLEKCEEVIGNLERTLWERTIGQEDFLELRVGVGEIPLLATMSFPEKRFSLENDNLFNDLLALAKEPKVLKNVPITISLLENNICGVIGSDRELTLQFVKGLLLRLVATHSYDEVKVMVIADEDKKSEWEFAKWLPHIWSDAHDMRYFATCDNDMKELCAEIEKSMDDTDNKIPEKYYVIINLSPEYGRKYSTIRKVHTDGKKYGYVVIDIAEKLQDIPKECENIIEISPKESRIFNKNDVTGTEQKFSADILKDDCFDMLARHLSNVKLNLQTQDKSLVNMITFLDMYGVGKIEHLNSLTRWKENNPIVTLKAPVGVDAAGELFYLDLHEKYQGPHGLIAGMTGSGKSEFIITYILSLAVNYHPDEVAFILIDYKGGGLAGAFEDKDKGIKLPHLAGTITNLDGAAVKRSLISIQSELRRRQAMFNEAKKVSGEGTIDIYKYQKLYRDGLVSEPIPHLMIISDEFAELKSQEPEFMQQLISTARIGRSLGVHLILATQKPNGVVNDQIWSNSRFKICLKVQSKQDSEEMIKRPDAAELSTIGRFYLQVGFNEYFALGQSAWCGAPYIPADSDRKNRKKDQVVRIIDSMGRIEKEVRESSTSSNEKESKVKQVVGIVEYLSDLAKEEKISVRPLWLDEIPENIYVDSIIEKYRYQSNKKYIVEAVIGEYDDPFNQSQNILTVSLSRGGNALLFGNAGSGKEHFLETLIYDLCNRYSPEYLNMYVLDFGSETLQMFAGAPHVGAVILSSEEEKLTRLLELLNKTLVARKKILSDNGGTYESYYKKNQEPMANTVVIINNFAALYELYEEAMDELSYLTREGIKYGIYFIITASSSNEVRYKIAQNFAQTFVLQMNDRMEYASILGNMEGIYPSKLIGRGVFKNKSPYEFQTAKVCEDDISDFVIQKCKEWTLEYKGCRAQSINVVPAHVHMNSFMDKEYMISAVPIGINLATVQTAYFDIQSKVIIPIFGNYYDGMMHFVKGWAGVLASNQNIHFEILAKGTSDDKIHEIFRMLVTRNNEYKKTGDNSSYQQHVYMVLKPQELLNSLSKDSREEFEAFVYKCEIEYNVHFIIVDEIDNVRNYFSQEWFVQRFNSMAGVWYGTGYNEQTRFRTNISSRVAREVKPECGFLLENGKFSSVKFVSACEQEDKE